MIVTGVLANLADDIRQLQRPEIAEFFEAFAEKQVGSSTMPQKRNPINAENVKSCWKIILPRMMTLYMDQISEHQRDLTNSASARTYGELLAYAVAMAKRMKKVLSNLKVDTAYTNRNLLMSEGMIAAEPLYILLASLGHPDAHSKVLDLTRESQEKERPFIDVVRSDEELGPYLERMTTKQRNILKDPTQYIGIAGGKAEDIAKKWASALNLGQ